MQQIAANILIDWSLLAILGLSLGIIYRVLGCFCFVPLAVATTAPYIAYACASGLGMPVAVSVAVGGVLAAGGGCLGGWLLYLTLKRRDGGPLSILTASLGVFIVVENAIAMIYGDDPLSITGATSTSIHAIGAARISTTQVTMIVLAALLSVGLSGLWKLTRAGLALRGIAEDQQLAAVSGITTWKYSGVVFLLSAICAVVAGMLAAFESELTPYMGFRLLLYAFACILISDKGGLGIVVLSALCLAGIRNIAVLAAPVRWQDSIVFALVLLVVLARQYLRETPFQTARREH